MSFAPTNNMVWKQIADEKEQMARQMARLALGMFIVSAVLAGTTFSARSNYSSMCSFVGERIAADDDSLHDEELKKTLLLNYCS